ncbi:outer membrane protein OmpA-like peptidoglycan-associated protein [Burkholderia ambifaria]|nr:OmpA family protein [Burkholderia ambifaria]MDR6504045.1 outer membrane protein OmpA-like peptidoglycan-associated protein [Burkholderia ambifaria]
MMKVTNLLLALGVTTVLAGCLSTGPTFTARSVARVDGPQAFEVTCYGIFEGRNACFTKAKEICDKYSSGKPVYPLEDYAPLGSTSNGKPNTNTLMFQCGAPAEPPAPAAQPVAEPVAQAAPPVVMAPQKVTLGADALFDTDKAALRPLAHEKLDKLLHDANGMTFERVTIDGYTDSRGAHAHNQVLSQRRAQAVARYLESRGLKSQHFIVKGHGAAHPVASNATAEGRAQNRRVDITLETQQ